MARVPGAARAVHLYTERVAKAGGGFTYKYPKGYVRGGGRLGRTVPGTAARSIGVPATRTAAIGKRAPINRNGHTLYREPFQRQLGYSEGWRRVNLRHEGFHLTTIRPTNAYYGASQISTTRRALTVRLTGNAGGKPVVYSTIRPSRLPQKGIFEKSYSPRVVDPSQVTKTYRNPTGSSLRRLASLYDRGKPSGIYGL